ncbi:DoxX family protein [Acidiphilium sp. PA]|uniref:DoxX family protein n=1 Tax=Acidiphilium sp. PA TaxID=2871705 RepID=UPI002244E030|nr:DoxX family protein [Acidiphilium sp. PA]MCW8306991.1 DoxX family protein [Acidiphilium sp. PA]
MKTTQRGTSDIGLLLGRLALATVFLQAGLSKLTAWPGIVHLLTRLHAPYPLLGAIIAIASQLTGGLMVALGLRARTGALILILFTLGANWLTHRFWLMHGPAAAAAEIQCLLDLAICGGLLILASTGPGRFAVDRR